MRPDGQRVVVDRGSISGNDLSGNFDALDGMNAACSVLVIAPPDRLADIAEIEAAADQCGCLTGVTAAPNQAGLAMRLLAPDGGTLVRGIEAAFHVAARAALGVELAPRRK
jgi:urease accessory protein